MQIFLLDAKHPEYKGDRWRDNLALYEGGELFEQRVRNFIQKNPQEMPDVYEFRVKDVTYRSYIGSITDYLAGAVFERPADFNTGAKGQAPEWFAAWREDVDGEGADFTDFLNDVFIDSLRAPRGYILLEAYLPEVLREPISAAEHAAGGAQHVQLTRLCPEDVYDWEYGPDRKLNWCITHSCKDVRPTPMVAREWVEETWRFYDRVAVYQFRIQYKKGERPPLETELVAEMAAHGFDQVPIVPLDVPKGLRLVERLRGAQIGHLRESAALDYSVRQTAYAMPIIFDDNVTDPGTMGSGYFWKLSQEAKVGWLSPPTESHQLMAQNIEAKRQEIYRLAHQMALGVDNNASSIGRSAESKLADSKNTNTMLGAWGTRIRECAKSLLDLISSVRRETETWRVEGFDSFESIDLAALLDAGSVVAATTFPSPTLRKVYFRRLARAVVPDLSQDERDAIDKEIEDNVSDDVVDPLEAALASARASRQFGGAPAPTPATTEDA